MHTTGVRVLGIVLFFLGIFIGLALAAAAIWANFEAVFYNYTQLAYDEYKGLHCPVLMTTSETAKITATFDNPSNDVIYPYYQVQLSSPGPLQKFENQITVDAHKSQTVEWTVDSSNIDLGFFVMVKFTVNPVGGYSSRETTCGIIALDIPGLNGSQIFWLVFILSLLGTLVGFWLWVKNSEPLKSRQASQKNAMQTLAILTFGTMFFGLLGWWGQGIILGAITLLFMVVMLRFAFK